MSALNAQRADNIIRNSAPIHAMGMGRNILECWESHNREANEHTTRGADRAVWFSGMAKSVRLRLQMRSSGPEPISSWIFKPDERLDDGLLHHAGARLGAHRATHSAWKHFVTAREAYGRILDVLDALEQERVMMLLPAPTGRIVCEDGAGHPAQAGRAGADRRVLCGRARHGRRRRRAVWSRQIEDVQDRRRDLPTRRWAAGRGRCVRMGRTSSGPMSATCRRTRSCSRAASAKSSHAWRPSRFQGRSRRRQDGRAHEMILAFPEGDETMLGEERNWLSGGQRQRLALARTLYRRRNCSFSTSRMAAARNGRGAVPGRTRPGAQAAPALFAARGRGQCWQDGFTDGDHLRHSGKHCGDRAANC